MTTPKLTISDLQFFPARGDDDDDGADDRIGRISLCLNGFMRFRNLPVRRRPDGDLRIGFPEPDPSSLDGFAATTTTPPIPDHIRRAIESGVAAKIAEAVR
jgi:hypothetical protein